MPEPSSRNKTLVVGAAAVAALLLVGCAAGDPRFSPETPAGFFTGVWHGMISVIALFVGVFHDGVEIYERSNTGGWYDLGFIFGITMIWGGGSHTYHRRERAKRDDKEWEEIGRKVEAKVKRKIGEWAEAEPDEEWEVVAELAQGKLKRKIRKWAEEPEEPEEPKA